MKCPKCQFDNPDDSRFCAECGMQLLPPDEKATISYTETLPPPVSGLTIGSTFAGRYKIIKELGKGGMGVVYKAEDSKLKRTVALKSITPQISVNEETRLRFVREAQAAAAMNHPNICTVYEVDEAEGKSFIAMEYIEGQSLRERLKERPLDVNRALALAIQMVEGLWHAHTRGIIHRDIKSANIMIQKTDQAKIMDFGLAKLAGSTMITKEGSTFGTIAYMSPEQAKGGSVDHRTDIWSLGVVLYESLSGQLPFQGDFDQAVIYSIINESPQALTALRSGIPLEFERIINKCLEKDPSYRYQSAPDLLTDLKRLKRDLDTEKVTTFAPSTPPLRKGFKIPLRVKNSAFIISVVLVLIAVYLLFLRPVSQKPISEMSLVPLTGGEGLCVFPSWSPDGAWIAYASDEAGTLDIWKKPTVGGEAIRITTGLHNESQPAWSPDGRNIAFFSDKDEGGIFLIPSEGGTPFNLTSFGAHPAWSPDGETLSFDWYGNIYFVPCTGGEPRLVIRGTSATPYTVWTPDGEGLIFWNRTKGDIFNFSIKEGKSKPLGLVPSGQEISGLALSKDGRELVFSRGPFGGNKDLWKIEIDPETGKPVGTILSLSVTTTDDIHCAFSPEGSRLAFTASQLGRNLLAFPIDPTTGLTAGKAERITYRCRLNYYPAFSPDGRMLVWTSHLTTQGLLSTLNLEEGEERKVTREWGQRTREVGGSFAPDGKQICYSSTVGGSYEVWRLPSLGSVALKLTRTTEVTRDSMTAWSPDGKAIAFYSNRMGNWDIWSTQADGRGEPKQLTQWESNENYPCWSPDSQQIAFRTDREGNGDIWIMDADGGNKKPYVAHSAEEGWSSWSPDGRWFYFISNRGSGVFNVWVRPTRGGESRQVTDYKGLSSGLPDFVLFTKFAVSSTRLVIPLEVRKGNIYILENLK